MHAKGGSDFITLELIKGKLRYAVLNVSLSFFKTSFVHFQLSTIAMQAVARMLISLLI